MQWADLRWLSSSTRRVARMHTTATRRLLLPPLLYSSLRWHRLNTKRMLWAGARPLAKDNDNNNKRSDKNEDKNRPKAKSQPKSQPSISEEIFPEEELSSLRYRGKSNTQREYKEQPESSSSTSSSKVRIVTSTHVDKSEATEWRAAQETAKGGRELANSEYRRKKQEAVSKIAGMLVPKNRRWGAWGSDIPKLGSKPGKDGCGGSGSAGGHSNSSAVFQAKDEPPSLFDELFKSNSVPKTTTIPAVEDRRVNHGDLQAWIDSLPRADRSGSSPDEKRPAMLSLSNASPNLCESDFYRVGPQGQHLDGWGASISKVMQAYDYNTLQPLGRYFILFDSHAAAAAYQIEAQRRYNLSRRALQSTVTPFLTTPPEPGGASVFTLAPPSKAPLNLHLCKLNKATEARLEAFSIQGILSMTPDPPPRACSQVIFSLEGGTLDRRALSQWIRRDARDRGLGWPVQHMRAYFPPKVRRKVDRHWLASELPVYEYEWDEDAAPKIVDPEKEAKQPMEETARSALFVLSFPDAHEGRRFVRAWHRKELVSSRGQSVIVSTHFVW